MRHFGCRFRKCERGFRPPRYSILAHYPSFLGIITQKMRATFLSIDSCLQKTTLHHATLLSIDAFLVTILFTILTEFSNICVIDNFFCEMPATDPSPRWKDEILSQYLLSDLDSTIESWKEFQFIWSTLSLVSPAYFVKIMKIIQPHQISLPIYDD